MDLCPAVWAQFKHFRSMLQKIGRVRVGAMARIVMFEGPNWNHFLEGLIVCYSVSALRFVLWRPTVEAHVGNPGRVVGFEWPDHHAVLQ